MITAEHRADSVASRISAREDAKLPPRWSRPVRVLADEILTLAKLPRLSWGFAEIDRLAPFIAGTMAVLLGPTGRGKSALAFQIARHHAEHTGPVLVVSAELTGAIAGARMVAQHSNLSWLSIMAGELEIELMREALDVPRLFLADDVGRDALRKIDAEIAALRRDFPGQTVLVVVDYLQLISADGQVDPRARVESVAVALRKLAVKHGCGMLALSKAGRTAARALRGGEMTGADATEASAESGAVEHEAANLLAIGEAKADPNDVGIVVVDVSIPKARFGAGGDQIVPLRWRGASGVFSDAGEAVRAADRKAESASRRKVADLEKAKLSIVGRLAKSAVPMSGADLRRELLINSNTCNAAIRDLMAEDPAPIIRVQGKKSGGAWPLWTPDRAAAAGVAPIPQAVIDAG